MVPDSRAHGTSEGEFVTYGLMEKYDVIGCYRVIGFIGWAGWMKTAGCAKLYGLGESLGASVLIEAAAVQPVFDAIVAECPFANLRDTAEFRVRQMSNAAEFFATPAAKFVVGSSVIYARLVNGLDLGSVSPVHDIRHAATPIFLIHGLKDDRTPFDNSVRLARANSGNELWLVPNAVHTGASAAEPEEFRRRVVGWFANH